MAMLTKTPLSPRTEALLRHLFPEARLCEKVRRKLIERCGTGMPMCEHSSPEGLERLRFAALKLSRGTFEDLDYAVELANTDWRDVLVAAGFGSGLDAHEQWYAEVLARPNPWAAA